jgi:hypothetical protein
LPPDERQIIYEARAKRAGALKEASVVAERAFTCGKAKYYVVEQHGHLIVQRQDWLGRTFIGYAADVAEAIRRIEGDAHCWEVQAA